MVTGSSLLPKDKCVSVLLVELNTGLKNTLKTVETETLLNLDITEDYDNYWLEMIMTINRK